jgi:hypothetical protein
MHSAGFSGVGVYHHYRGQRSLDAYPWKRVPRTADGKVDLNAPTQRTPDGKPDLSDSDAGKSRQAFMNSPPT